jgi:hypothetical protein
MGVEIVPLRCPSCGNAANTQGGDSRFGCPVKCGYCGTESILIINRMLYAPKPHEHVCLHCGRVATPNARFCQCGESLVQSCPLCQSEFPADHRICDQCGCPVEPDAEF